MNADYTVDLRPAVICVITTLPMSRGLHTKLQTSDLL